MNQASPLESRACNGSAWFRHLPRGLVPILRSRPFRTRSGRISRRSASSPRRARARSSNGPTAFATLTRARRSGRRPGGAAAPCRADRAPAPADTPDREGLLAWHKASDASVRPASIHGVGLVTGTGLAASVPDPIAFRSGRQFAARRGRVPRLSSSRSKVRLSQVSKLGNRHL